jgi:hypothetical protein
MVIKKPRMVRLGTNIDAAVDPIRNAFSGIDASLAGLVPRQSVSNTMSSAGGIIRAVEDCTSFVDPSSARWIVVPPASDDGSTFSVMNPSESSGTFSIDPGGVLIENPMALGTFVSGVFDMSGSAIRCTWVKLSSGVDSVWFVQSMIRR